MSRSLRDTQLRESKRAYKHSNILPPELQQAIKCEQADVPYVARYGNKRHQQAAEKVAIRRRDRRISNLIIDYD